MTPDEQDKSRQAVYELGDRRMTVSLNDARQMREALMTYGAAHRVELKEFGLEEEPGEPRIDSAGSIRIGAWLLDADNGRLVLGRRVGKTAQVGFSYRLLAPLEYTSDGRWTVKSIQTERILPRR